MTDATKSFLTQTAIDYDIDVTVVERINMQSESSTVFYEKLEEYIKNRSLNISN